MRQLVTTQRAVWIGLFESGEQDESGVWEWVNGMSDTWRNWQPGEPNEWCTDEDCGLLAPGLWDGWVDASCTVRKSNLAARLTGCFAHRSALSH